MIECGSALFDGEDLLACDKDRMRQLRGNHIAMIFQDPMTSLNPFLTIGEQLIEPLIYHPDKPQRLNRKAAQIEAIDLLDEVGIINPKARFNSYPTSFLRYASAGYDRYGVNQ